MSLAERIERELIEAMKAKNVNKLSTLRLVKAAMTNLKIEKKKDALTDDECLDVLSKQVKQRRDSIASFESAGRNDLKAKEQEELTILEGYMPKALSDDEIRKFAQEAIQASGAKTKAETGKVMKELMPKVKGRADGKKVQEILGSLLA